MMLNTDVDGHT